MDFIDSQDRQSQPQHCLSPEERTSILRAFGESAFLLINDQSIARTVLEHLDKPIPKGKIKSHLVLRLLCARIVAAIDEATEAQATSKS